jgi:hypothetical protein
MAKGTLNPPSYAIRLAEALRSHLPGAVVDFEPVRRDRYRFLVIWKRFNKRGHPERQERVWDIVVKTLAPKELLKVAMIITLGTDEANL